MIWDKADTPQKIQELVAFESCIFSEEDLSTVQDYMLWIQHKGLKIHLFRDLNKNIIGSFQVFEENDKFYMGGFAVAEEHRGSIVAATLMRKLIKDYGKKEIICKTRPDNHPMRKFLTKNEWENNLDKFEGGVLWMWWVFNKGNKVLRQKIK